MGCHPFIAQVAFAAATFASTSEIEQQFSLVQMLSSGRKAKTSVSHLRSFLKCRLNGYLAASSARVSMVGLKRQRQAQLKNLQPATDVADLEQLQTAAAASSADRKGAKHEKLAKRLRNLQKRPHGCRSCCCVCFLARILHFTLPSTTA